MPLQKKNHQNEKIKVSLEQKVLRQNFDLSKPLKKNLDKNVIENII